MRGRIGSVISDGVMTARERYVACTHFRPVDRAFNMDMGPWPSAFRLWKEGGFPEDVHFGEHYGFDRIENVPVNTGMVPLFEEVTLERDDRARVFVDPRGVKQREFLVGRDISMPYFLEFPVKNRGDFLEIKKRYNPQSPARYPPFWESQKKAWQIRDYPLGLGISRDSPSFFGCIREWTGLETLIYAFYDEPRWVEETMDFLADFFVESLRKVCREVDLDFAFFWEDMCYKTGPFISPQMFRKFMLPRYKRVTEMMRKNGIDLLVVDSDGNLDQLIPLWLEAGVNAVWPIEIAANNDPVKWRKQYGKELVMFGGIDKRALAKDRKAIEEEVLGKVPWLIEQGGYIPMIDHGVPFDVSLENYEYYLELKYKVIQGQFGA